MTAHMGNIQRFDLTPILPFVPRLEEGGVGWDLDATLITNNECYALDHIGEFYKAELAAAHGITDSQDYRPYAGMPLDKIRKTINDFFEVEIAPSIDQRIKEGRKLQPRPNEKINVHPFFLNLLRLFDDRGITQCVVTGSEPDRALRYIKAAGLEYFFNKGKQPWLFSGEKPNPACYQEWMEATRKQKGLDKIDPSRFISFEDSASGVIAGVRAGANVIGHLFAEHIPVTRHGEMYLKLMENEAASVIKNTDRAVSVVEHVLRQLVPA